MERGFFSLFFFAAGMFLFQFVSAVTFPSIGGTRNVQAVFEALGPDMQRLLKLAPNLQAGFGPANYLAFGYFHPVFLGLGSAFVVSRASDAIAGDIERGTVLFILSRPVLRQNLLLGKTLEMLLSLLLVVFVAIPGTYLGVLLADPGEPVPLERFWLVGLNACALFLALGGVALVISALSSSAARVAGWATAFALLAFTADFLSALPVVNLIGFLSPFRFYDPQALVANGEIPWAGLAVLSGTALVGYFLAAFLFKRRDIRA
jgi:ABC-2 type transport system permease protein